MSVLLDERGVRDAVANLAERIRVDHPAGRPLNIVGIRTRGDTLAARLAGILADAGLDVRRGTMDITLYRDDLSEIGPGPMVRPSRIDFSVTGEPMILVDDVIYTGRSVRAALSELNDFGRPAYVRLAVLVDRGGRELPIQPDYAALTISEMPTGGRINVRLVEDDGHDAVHLNGAGTHA